MGIFSIKKLHDGRELHEYRNKDGKLHHIACPASVLYDKKGNPLSRCYYLFGRLHRSNGPACMINDEFGNIQQVHKWLFWERVS